MCAEPVYRLVNMRIRYHWLTKGRSASSGSQEVWLLHQRETEPGEIEKVQELRAGSAWRLVVAGAKHNCRRSECTENKRAWFRRISFV